MIIEVPTGRLGINVEPPKKNERIAPVYDIPKKVCFVTRSVRPDSARGPPLAA